MALQIFATGTTIATSATSAGTTIPLASNGAVPRFVRVVTTQYAYVRIGTGAQTAVAGDLMVGPSDGVIIASGGNTHIAALQVTTAGVVQVSPVEDI
jgi:regulator of RNase E activity RraA